MKASFLFACALAAAQICLAQATISVRVTRVLDGDTIEVDGKRPHIRISSIDAPEASHGYGKPGQPYSAAATKRLQTLLENKDGVSLKCVDEDRYNRPVCFVAVDGSDAGRMLVSEGLAWANTSNPRYLRDRTLLDLQAQAQRERTGLWREPKPIPPWRWRKDCWEAGACE